MGAWIEGRIVAAKYWNQRLCSLTIAADMPTFSAGQFVRVGLEIDGKMMARPYSLVNAPREEHLEIYFNKVPEGPLSTRLHGLSSGDSLFVSTTPAGFFTVEEVPAGEDLWMLATGTALGPFLSMLKTDEPWEKFQRIVLVHGVRTADERTYLELIDEIKEQQGARFSLLHSVTREQVSEVLTLSDRISDSIASGQLEKMAGETLSPERSRVMICGNPGMVKGCVAALEQKGLSKHRRRTPGEIILEIYK